MLIRSRWVAATVIAVCAVVAPALPTAAETTTDPADAAAGWLGRQLVDGNHLEVTFGGTAYPDAGLTIDAILAFTAAGVGGAASDAALAWVGGSDVLGGYIGDGGDASYAGSLAKVALVAQVRGADPTAFGADGVDLIDRLTARQQPSGRFSDQSAFGDFSGTFSQAFALLALHRAGATSPVTNGAAYLVGEQCDDGGFPETFEQPTCTSQVDATALAVQALLAVGDTAGAGDAVAYLEALQDDDGGYGNANTTGLVAAALSVAGSTAAADAVDAIVALQQGCTAAPGDRGGIAFDASGFDDRAARATSQAVPGLVGANLATLSVASEESSTLPELACQAAPTTTSTSFPSTSTTASEITTTLPHSPPSVPVAAGASATAPGAATASLTGELPRTGSDVGATLQLGALALGAGAVLVLAARRRRGSSLT